MNRPRHKANTSVKGAIPHIVFSLPLPAPQNARRSSWTQSSTAPCRERIPVTGRSVEGVGACVIIRGPGDCVLWRGRDLTT